MITLLLIKATSMVYILWQAMKPTVSMLYDQVHPLQ